MIRAEHDIDAKSLYSLASKAVGGWKILADAIGSNEKTLHKMAMEESSSDNPEAYGLQSHLEAVEKIMIALSNCDHQDIAFMFIKHLWETYDQIQGERMEKHIRALQEEKDKGRPWSRVASVLKLFALFI